MNYFPYSLILKLYSYKANSSHTDVCKPNHRIITGKHLFILTVQTSFIFNYPILSKCHCVWKDSLWRTVWCSAQQSHDLKKLHMFSTPTWPALTVFLQLHAVECLSLIRVAIKKNTQLVGITKFYISTYCSLISSWFFKNVHKRIHGRFSITLFLCKLDVQDFSFTFIYSDTLWIWLTWIFDTSLKLSCYFLTNPIPVWKSRTRTVPLEVDKSL